LLWSGAYYQVWGRRPHTPAALAHLGLYASRSVDCKRVAQVAGTAKRHHGQLVAAVAPQAVGVDLNWASPRSAYRLGQLSLTANASVRLTFRVPRTGRWDLWLRGEVMPAVAVSVDGRRITKLADQLDGNDFNPDTIGPLRLRLVAGRHRLTFTPAGSILAPGAVGEASLGRIFLTDAGGRSPGATSSCSSDCLGARFAAATTTGSKPCRLSAGLTQRGRAKGALRLVAASKNSGGAPFGTQGAVGRSRCARGRSATCRGS